MFLCCCVFILFVFFFFFFKQKTAYEMRISDWSSDVCSSDLDRPPPPPLGGDGADGARRPFQHTGADRSRRAGTGRDGPDAGGPAHATAFGRRRRGGGRGTAAARRRETGGCRGRIAECRLMHPRRRRRRLGGSASMSVEPSPTSYSP